MNKNYVLFALSHGFLRTLYYTHNAKIVEVEPETRQILKRNMLVTERASYAVFNSMVNLAVCPISVLDDVATMEFYVRGIKKCSRPFLFPFNIRYE
jgi:hypothetical protein